MLTEINSSLEQNSISNNKLFHHNFMEDSSELCQFSSRPQSSRNKRQHSSNLFDSLKSFTIDGNDIVCKKSSKLVRIDRTFDFKPSEIHNGMQENLTNGHLKSELESIRVSSSTCSNKKSTTERTNVFNLFSADLEAETVIKTNISEEKQMDVHDTHDVTADEVHFDITTLDIPEDSVIPLSTSSFLISKEGVTDYNDGLHSSNVFDYLTSLKGTNSLTASNTDDDALKASKKLDADSISSGTTCLVHVREIYQDMFLLNDSQDGPIIVTPNGDPLETSFNVPVLLDQKGCLLNETMNFPPRFLSQDEQSPIVDVSDRLVEKVPSENCCNETSLLQWCHSTLKCYHETARLRSAVFQLLRSLVPDFIRPLPDFDRTSLASEHLLDAALEILSRKSLDDNNDEKDAIKTESVEDCQVRQLFEDVPLVTLCSDSVTCLERLRTKVLRLTRALTPQLLLPEIFTVEDHLEDLLIELILCAA